MKNLSLLFCLLMAALMAWLGYYVYPAMVMWLMPQVEHVRYAITSPGDYVTDALWFGLACSLIPLILYFVWNLTQTTDAKGKTLSVFILLSISTSAILIHYWIIQDLIDNAKTLPGVTSIFDLGELMYHFYLLMGELIGTTVAFYVLKKRNKSVL